MRNYKKLLEDLAEWHNWCIDNPTEKRGQIAYYIDKLLNETKGTLNKTWKEIEKEESKERLGLPE